MSRKKTNYKRDVLPDPKHGSELISKYINMVMKSGKKAVAEKIVYGAMEQVAEKEKGDIVEITERALEKVKPMVEVKSRRVGGATYQVPVEVRQERGTALGMRWIIRAARSRNDKSMSIRLSRELIDASNNEGGAVRKKDEVHRMADANKAFAHFRF